MRSKSLTTKSNIVAIAARLSSGLRNSRTRVSLRGSNIAHQGRRQQTAALRDFDPACDR
jgi:hypothetical protein